MNIFVTDSNPRLAAISLPDKLLVKMVLETTQLLATAFSEKYLNLGTLTKKDGNPYRPTHVNHPSVKWTSSNIHNAKWLSEHGIALSEEYTKRYGKIHSCDSQLRIADYTLESLGANSNLHSNFVMAMPDEFRSPDPVLSYRKYLHSKKYASWSKEPNSQPDWWETELFLELT